MIPAKIEPISKKPIMNTGVESIADWFNQHKQSFYILGCTYFRIQEQMEELFYRSILKVHKEIPRPTKEPLFDTRVASIFIQTCRELSKETGMKASAERESRPDFFKALDQLKEDEREAIALAFIKGMSRADAGQLLNVSPETMNELLFSGIQSLKNGLGYRQSMKGCKSYQEKYIDYLEGTMARPEKIDFEIHVYHCRDCQDDLATFQEVVLTLKNFAEGIKNFRVPSNFMENVEARLAERDKKRQEKLKKRKRIGFAFAGIFALLIAIEVLTGSFSNVYYAHAEENAELRGFLRHGFGKVLNLEAESGGVKVRIKSVIADEVQTLIFYEVEDTAEDYQYMINIHDGFSVENMGEIMNRDTQQRFYPPHLEWEANKKGKNVYRGKVSLLPLKKENGTIKLKITRLQKLKLSDLSVQNVMDAYNNIEYETGEWNFEIPVTRLPSAEYALNGETEVEGIPVRFEKLTIAPTITILQYAYENGQAGKRMEFLRFNKLEVNGKKVKAEKYPNNNYIEENMNWISFQSQFDPFFGDKPKGISVQFESALLTIEDLKTIILDASQSYPQTFEYAGSTISIDKFEIGTPTTIVISDHEIKNRTYDSFWFDVAGDYENGAFQTEMYPEGVIVDANGKKYNLDEIINYEEIENPRHLTTVNTIRLQSNQAGEIAIPKRLVLQGYNKTKYMDDVVKISVK
ncbi:hypothetical protein DRW41_11480 [Neobacillus piezotolerans]|uniref:DUF4179 domain-containing protein n=1 Tax=Neobacillus piezotolerans TaxID=2259171 RepID=A0A3D8GQW4_9BACI|nr:DUF4179 domain-containing protein [Neobacillus piezotolerans]RDU36672.1 hypothetical protein DRW41_11480 [Neobacillus piezotolerans]